MRQRLLRERRLPVHAAHRHPVGDDVGVCLEDDAAVDELVDGEQDEVEVLQRRALLEDAAEEEADGVEEAVENAREDDLVLVHRARDVEVEVRGELVHDDVLALEDDLRVPARVVPARLGEDLTLVRHLLRRRRHRRVEVLDRDALTVRVQEEQDRKSKKKSKGLPPKDFFASSGTESDDEPKKKKKTKGVKKEKRSKKSSKNKSDASGDEAGSRKEKVPESVNLIDLLS